MAEKNPNHDWETTGGDPLDRELNAALARYTAVEPRPGIEERILATLRSAKAHVPAHSWSQWGTAAALAAVAVLVIVASLRFEKTAHPVTANRPQVSIRESPNSQVASDTQRAGHGTIVNTAHVHRVRRTARHLAQVTNVAADSPKLDQFPSPQPLTEQEKAALEYVQRYPEQASLMAQAQTSLAKQEALEKNSAEHE